ncbi:hypothetical protein Tco_0744799, partial [Tanacetum coccineum]
MLGGGGIGLEGGMVQGNGESMSPWRGDSGFRLFSSSLNGGSLSYKGWGGLGVVVASIGGVARVGTGGREWCCGGEGEGYWWLEVKSGIGRVDRNDRVRGVGGSGEVEVEESDEGLCGGDRCAVFEHSISVILGVTEEPFGRKRIGQGLVLVFASFADVRDGAESQHWSEDLSFIMNSVVLSCCTKDRWTSRDFSEMESSSVLFVMAAKREDVSMFSFDVTWLGLFFLTENVVWKIGLAIRVFILPAAHWDGSLVVDVCLHMFFLDIQLAEQYDTHDPKGYSSFALPFLMKRYIQRGQPDAGFPLFESESLKWPGFVEFDDVNGKVLTYSAQDSIYKVFDLKNYTLLYSVAGNDVDEIKISPGIMLLIYKRAQGHVPLKILSIEDGKVLKDFNHLLHRNKKVDFIEQFNEKLLVKQDDENLQILDVRNADVKEVSKTEFMTPSAFIFLYENQLFLTFRNRTVSVWNFRGELVTSFEDHELWHPDCNTNNIYITSGQDVIISFCKSNLNDQRTDEK